LTGVLDVNFFPGTTSLDASQEELAEFLGMGTRLGRFLDTYSWRGFLRRLIGRRNSRNG